MNQDVQAYIQSHAQKGALFVLKGFFQPGVGL